MTKISSGYAYSWQSQQVADGVHTLTASAIEQDGQRVQSNSIQIEVSNRVTLGAAMNQWEMPRYDPQAATTFLANFDQLTPESEMKWAALEPAEGKFTFQTADAMVNWAVANHKSVHGHNLVWYMKLPPWLTSVTWTPAGLSAILKQHITTIVSHFRGRVAAWDVVNEPLADNGAMRRDIFYNVLGLQYISDALIWAHQADPGAQLYINEYGIETVNAKSTALLALVKQLLAQGVPLDGIGFEMHVSTADYPTTSELEASMARFGALGLRTDISEMDVRTATTAGTIAQKLAAEATVYSDAAKACAGTPSCTRFTTWGVSDAWSWLGSSQMGLLFDSNYAAKPAWADVMRALNSKP